VPTDLRAEHATRETPYGELAAVLAGRGGPSIEHAVRQVHHRPVHRPPRAKQTTRHFAYLSKPTPETRKVFEEKLGHLADGLAFMIEKGKEKPVIDAAAALTRYDALVAKTPLPDDTDLLLAWIQTDAALDLLASSGPALARSALLDAWAIPMALVDAFQEDHDEREAQRRASLVLLALTLPGGDLREVMHVALGGPRGRMYMNVHESDGVVWLNKERFDELARLLGEREALLDERPLEEGRTTAAELSKTAETEGFKAEAIAAALAPKKKAPEASEASPDPSSSPTPAPLPPRSR
jgi:hypothetical protein